MQRIKRLVAFLTSVAMCGAFSGSACVNAVFEQEPDVTKISDRLLEEYGVDRASLLESGFNLDYYDASISVIVWGNNDIDIAEIEQTVLPIIVSDIEEKGGRIIPSNGEYVTLDDVLYSTIEPSDDAVQSFIETKRALSREEYLELNEEFIQKHLACNEVSFISSYSPVIIASLKLEDVLELTCSDDVALLDYYCEEEVEPEPQDVSIEATKARTVQTATGYGYTGQNIKIGQIDSDVPYLTNSQLAPIISNITRSGSTHTGTHSTIAACVMVGQNDGTYDSGMAPNAKLYSASCADFSGNDFEAIEWLLSHGVNVINASHAIGHIVDRNSYNIYAKWLDHIAVNHNVTFVESAGNLYNGDIGVITGAMAYNIVTVGNVDDNNTIPVADDYRNSSSSYYGINTNLAYKPDLCAPGTNIVNAGTTGGSSGTSISAPHVTGAIALLLEAKPILKAYPAIVKALLTAAVSPDSNHRYCPTDSNYRQYGAGLLDIYQVIKAAKEYNYYSSTLTSTNHTQTFSMNISSSFSIVRVSLTFLRNNYAGSPHYDDTGLIVDPLQDIDIWVFDPDGNFVGRSNMLYTNVEIIEFNPTKSGNYTIKAVKSTNSYTTPVKIGLAWMKAS